MSSLWDRRYRRVEFHAPVRLAPPDARTPLSGTAINLSEAGMFVVTSALLEVGTPIACDVHLDGRYRPLKGRVAWVRAASTSPNVPAGMGIEFLELSGEDSRLLQDLVNAAGDGHAVKLWFEGAADPVVARASLVGGGIRLRTELPFLRVQSQVAFAPADRPEERYEGRLRAVWLEAAPGRPAVLEIDVRLPPTRRARGEVPRAAELADLAEGSGPTVREPAGVTTVAIDTPEATEENRIEEFRAEGNQAVGIRANEVGGKRGKDAGAEELGAEELGAEEVGAEEIGAEEVGAKEVGAKEVGAKEVGAKEVGAKEVGAKEVGAKEVGAKEGGAKEPRAEGRSGGVPIPSGDSGVRVCSAREEVHGPASEFAKGVPRGRSRTTFVGAVGLVVAGGLYFGYRSSVEVAADARTDAPAVPEPANPVAGAPAADERLSALGSSAVANDRPTAVDDVASSPGSVAEGVTHNAASSPAGNVEAASSPGVAAEGATHPAASSPGWAVEGGSHTYPSSLEDAAEGVTVPATSAPEGAVAGSTDEERGPVAVYDPGVRPDPSAVNVPGGTLSPARWPATAPRRGPEPVAERPSRLPAGIAVAESPAGLEITVALDGTPRRIVHYALADPDGVALNLDSFRARVPTGTYAIGRSGVRLLWVRERLDGQGQQVRVFFEPYRPVRVEPAGAGVRITIPRAR